VDNEISEGATDGFFIGSDSNDNLMYGLVVDNNTIITRGSGSKAIAYAYINELTVTNNKYDSPNFIAQTWDGHIEKLSQSDNIPIQKLSYTPQTPTNLALTKFLDSYLLQWDDNLKKEETQTYEYIVYRDGKKLPISPRGGTFYVDVDAAKTGEHTYQVSALNLTGRESPLSVPVSTKDAKNSWWDETVLPPTTKTGDLDNNGRVDIFDLLILLNKWNTSDTSADLNNSGKVDVFDLLLLLQKWGGRYGFNFNVTR
jgi:hypothetical protein